uniref:Ubiquitin domain containing 2 n=1 Tax=Eptatretus burgeri TaxID=7764 RepID=A0A8C4QU32_EPTBU
MCRNRPLYMEKLKWWSEYPMTEQQLYSKRDEFWDTAPAFDGHAEIWDALKAVTSAFEHQDLELAQAILDCANISLPHGSLTECYDELGNLYCLPIYCLVSPLNLVDSTDVLEAGLDDVYELHLRLCLSPNGKDVQLLVQRSDTVLQAKRRLQAQEAAVCMRKCDILEPGHQLWFFLGQLLLDRMHLDDVYIPQDFIVQVVLKCD